MATINPVPYQMISGRKDGELIIEIRNQEFAGIDQQEGRVEIAIENCLFNKVEIINKEKIDFKDISIAFFGCYIGELKIEQVISSNIHVSAYGSVLSGKIESDKLLGVELNNCLLNDNVFFINIRKIRITYTKENIKLSRWKALLKSLTGSNYRTLINGKQAYYIHDSKQLDFSSNFSSQKRKLLRLNLFIKYNKDVSDLSTSVANVQLDSLSISGSPNGKIGIESTKINKWYIYDFFPKGTVSFYNIEPEAKAVDTKIGIHQCNLDNTWFDNVSFVENPVILTILIRCKLTSLS